MFRCEESCRSNAARSHAVIHQLMQEPFTDYSVMMAKDGKIILDLTYKEGESTGAVNKTYFQVGSVTKAVTAVLLLKLVESGALSLYDPVGRYIPEWKTSETLILELLTHTSGIGEAGLSGITWPRIGFKQSYFEAIFQGVRLADAPGARRRYSTHLYAAATAVLEKAAGATLEQFGRAELFDPLGMDDTTYSIQRVSEQVAYALDASGGGKDMRLSELDATGDSGLVTRAGDLIKFGQMILDNGSYGSKQICSPATIALIKRDVTGGRFGKSPAFWTNSDSTESIGNDPDFRACFSDLHSPQALGHNGFTGCWFFVDPAFAATGVILTNSKKMNLSGDYYRRIGNVLMAL